MITMKELNPHNHPMAPAVEKNMKVLFDRMNELRQAYGKPMVITSGLRSDEKQAELIAQGKSNAKFSRHLAGAACDVFDKDKELAKWCLANEDILKRIGLWCEHPDYTANWVHFQIMAPNSGKRFFIP
jgi:uncharacterized protein YcbK (DUF882 family)